jgi:hypothetical protein
MFDVSNTKKHHVVEPELPALFENVAERIYALIM